MKRVAVTMRIVDAVGYTEPRDAVSEDWVRFLAACGVLPVLVPNVLDPVAFVRALGVDALLLTNGDDPAETERDRTERALFEHACVVRLPVLGVCRGLQVINQALGGTVVRDLRDHVGARDGHVATQHQVRLRGRLATLARRDQATVNSYHHHGVLESTLAPTLVACGVADGDIVEAVHHQQLPIWGVQWHPERPNPAADLDRAIVGEWLQ